jgi:hypothetical protein
MDVIREILLFLHFLGLAALFGGLFVQVRAERRVVSNAVLHGILTQLVTGLLLVGVAEGSGGHLDNAWVGVKLGIALLVAVMAFAGRRAAVLSSRLYLAMTVLTVANVGVAVFWH